MSLYPSLEDMQVDQMVKAQDAAFTSAASSAAAAAAAHYGQPQQQQLPYPVQNPSAPVYPTLGAFMGLELTEDVIRANMPEYLFGESQQQEPAYPVVSQQTGLASAGAGGSSGAATSVWSAPVTGSSLVHAQPTHGVRQVVLCKDGDGKVGLRVKSIDKGVFVVLVTRGSPSAMAGLRFGDQILQINGDNVAGFSESKVHDVLRKCGVNNIVLAVRDRPFERTLTLHKDSSGTIGFQFKEGKITAIAVNSSAARNGLLIEHYLLEVNSQNVVGVKDKEVSKIIDEGGPVVTVTLIPAYIYQHMMKNMSGSLVKKMMDHSVPDM